MGFFSSFKSKKRDDKNSEFNIITKLTTVINDDFSAKKALKRVLKMATPSKNGLFPHELMMLNYANSYNTNSNSFQSFWEYQYYVEDPKELLNSLEERGFIKIGDIKNTLENKKLSIIKEDLKKYGLKVSGKKAELIDLLLGNGNLKELEAKYSERYYQLTKLGEEELKDNEYILYIHRHSNYGINVWDMNLLMNQEPKMSYRDKLWGFFNKQSEEHINKFNFGLYRNTRLEMYKFLVEENKYKAALKFLFEVIYYDLSGLDNNEDVGDMKSISKSRLERKLENNFPYESSFLTIPPGIISFLEESQKELNLTSKDMQRYFLESVLKYKIESHFFTNDECGDIMLAEMENDKNKLEEIYKIAEKRLRKKLSQLK